jgi:hypothetical protein
MEEAPGPPCSHSSSGAEVLPERAGKNQKNKFELAVELTVKKPE